MKLISIAVPCYNSQEYMRKCINSLLIGGEEVEIIIVNDGSKDETANIAEEYKAKYPSIVKVVHQENGGHGEAVNTGIQNATGLYFKVVDSDDWVNADAYRQILEKVEQMSKGPETVDAFISNYVYEKQGAKHKRVMRYASSLPIEKVFSWNEIGNLSAGQYILMHSLIFRTEILRECKLRLPKHTFYVDNLFAFCPMFYVRKMYYLDVNFYRYFIGREDQSVNEQIMIGRIDQQIHVNKLMVQWYKEHRLVNKKQKRYLLHDLSMITTVSSILLLRSKLDENYEKKQELWKYIKMQDSIVYYKLRYCLLGRFVNLPGKSGRTVSVACYKLVQKIYGFN